MCRHHPGNVPQEHTRVREGTQGWQAEGCVLLPSAERKKRDNMSLPPLFFFSKLVEETESVRARFDGLTACVFFFSDVACG